jgi:hypothetical protein
MRYVPLIILSIFTLPKGVHAQEYRGGVSAGFEILHGLKGEAEIEIRKIFIPEKYFNRTFQGSVTYNMTKSWTAGITYSYAIISEEDDDDNGDKAEEAFDRNKLSIDAEYQPKRFGNDLRFSNRFRYQVSRIDDDEVKQYIRNRVMVDYKVSTVMNPYVALEPYYRFDKNKVNILRIYIGNEMPLFSSKINIFYIAEIHPGPEYPTAQYIIGLKLELDFKKSRL